MLVSSCLRWFHHVIIIFIMVSSYLQWLHHVETLFIPIIIMVSSCLWWFHHVFGASLHAWWFNVYGSVTVLMVISLWPHRHNAQSHAYKPQNYKNDKTMKHQNDIYSHFGVSWFYHFCSVLIIFIAAYSFITFKVVSSCSRWFHRF